MSTPALTIITCGDTNFYFALKGLEDNVRQFHGYDPVIYDLGLTDEERTSLRSEVVSLDVGDSFREHTPAGNIRTHHKPAAILHALDTYGRPVLYLDADAMLTEQLDPTPFIEADLAVTPRHPREAQKANAAENGLINAGVLFFGNTKAARTLIADWAAACEDATRSDQRALSDLLFASAEDTKKTALTIGDAHVALLDAVLWNDVGRKTGYIFHYKEIGRNSKKTYKRRQWEDQLAGLATRPWRAQLGIRLRRRLYLMTGRV